MRNILLCAMKERKPERSENIEGEHEKLETEEPPQKKKKSSNWLEDFLVVEEREGCTQEDIFG